MSQAAGRRRGRPPSTEPGDFRAAIVRAAAAEFAEHGYDATSLRAVARRAQVDPALVHHYFDGKADLFIAAVGVPLRPDKALDALLAGSRDEIGAGIVRFIGTQLQDRNRRERVVAMLKALVAGQPAGLAARGFIARELMGRLAAVAAPPDPELRAALAGSQLLGMLIARYVLELEPLASAPVDDLVDRVGPAIQYHLLG